MSFSVSITDQLYIIIGLETKLTAVYIKKITLLTTGERTDGRTDNSSFRVASLLKSILLISLKVFRRNYQLMKSSNQISWGSLSPLLVLTPKKCHFLVFKPRNDKNIFNLHIKFVECLHVCMYEYLWFYTCMIRSLKRLD